MKLFSTVLVMTLMVCKVYGQDSGNNITDIDGNQYNTIAIGNQVWMKENLRTSRFADGTAIPLTIDNKQWCRLTSGGFCWYNNDSIAGNVPYGKLYNWYAVQSGKLCPSGWHVPSDFEWTDLAEFLGGTKVAGGKLKENSVLWKSPNKNATNDVGFSAIPGGYRNSIGKFFYRGYFDYWWSSTELSSISSWYWYVYFDTAILYRDKDFKTMGHAVRCIKNSD
jgi:uncharacterized protein (TIGR02145 family)